MILCSTASIGPSQLGFRNAACCWSNARGALAPHCVSKSRSIPARSEGFRGIAPRAGATFIFKTDKWPYRDYFVPICVTADNTASEHYTKLTVETQDFPGLMLNIERKFSGLSGTVRRLQVQDVAIENTATTDDNMMTEHSRWYSWQDPFRHEFRFAFKNTKLTDDQAKRLAEDVHAFVRNYIREF